MPEVDHVVVDVFEVFFRLGSSGRTETLVVFNFPILAVFGGFVPLFVVGQRKETFGFVSLGGFDNRRDEFFEEAFDFQQARPEVVNEVDDQAFDVGAIVVLICHYHD